MTEITVKQLRPYLYSLSDGGASSFLIIGDDKACLLDTMNGFSDLYEKVKSVTDKEIIVVNTHGHPDHIYGNVYYDKVYINPKDEPLALSFYEDSDFSAKCRENNLKTPEFAHINDGDSIQLGGKTLSVYELSGHTDGGILLLLEEERILFTGDNINHHLWMQLPHSQSLKVFKNNLEKLLHLEEKADLILHGHATDFDDISLLKNVYKAVCDIIDGKTEYDKEYQWFGGTALQHPFEINYEMRYSQPDHVICYNKDNI